MRIFLSLLFAAALVLADDKADVESAAKDLAQAQMKKDKATLEKLLSDDIVYSHSSGMRETKAEHIKAVMNPKNRYTNIDYKETSVRVYGNTAVLITKATFSVDNDGKKADNVLSMMQTWVKRPSGWQLVARWTTRLTQ